MPKRTSVSLGDHFERFIAEQIGRGRYGSASEVVRAALRLLEEHEARLASRRDEATEGDADGDARTIGMKDIIRAARGEAIVD